MAVPRGPKEWAGGGKRERRQVRILDSREGAGEGFDLGSQG